MRKNLPVSKAQEALRRLPDDLAGNGDIVAVTDHGHPVLAMMSWEEYASLEETLEIMADEEMMEAIRQDQADREAGIENAIPWEQVKRDLHL